MVVVFVLPLFSERRAQSLVNQSSISLLLPDSLLFLEVLLKRPPNFRPCPVKQYSLIRLRNSKNVTNFFCSPPFYIMQGDDGLLTGSQSFCARQNPTHGFLYHHPILRQPVPF